jgi:hypothetical protein
MFLLFAAAAAAALAPNSTPFTDARPPARFQREAITTLQISDQAGINLTCQALFGAPPAGMKTDACFTGERMVMPNPCSFPQTESYARMLCHELGHVNGWPSTHGDFPDDVEVAEAERPARGAATPAAGQGGRR